MKCTEKQYQDELHKKLELLRMVETICLQCKIKGRNPDECFSCFDYNRAVRDFNKQLDSVISMPNI